MSNSQESCDNLLITLRKIIRAIDLHSKKLVRKYGLTGPQMLLLKVVTTSEDRTMNSSEIANKMSLSLATVTSILDRLAQKGHVQRIKSTEDKRKTYIKPTDSAKEIFKKNPTLLQEDFINQFEALKDWEQSLMISSLERIAEMMNAKAIDADPVLANTDLITTK
jgi:DNA-binding MarR family transcriptional regulator